MNHRGTGAQLIQGAKSRLVKLCLRALVVIFAFSASAVLACPRCVDATPYKSGLLWAVAFLLPIPFLLVAGVAAWVVRHSKPKFPPF